MPKSPIQPAKHGAPPHYTTANRPNIKPATAPTAEELLLAARRALRSHQSGNTSRELAAGVADAIDDYFNYQR